MIVIEYKDGKLESCSSSVHPFYLLKQLNKGGKEAISFYEFDLNDIMEKNPKELLELLQKYKIGGVKVK